MSIKSKLIEYFVKRDFDKIINVVLGTRLGFSFFYDSLSLKSMIWILAPFFSSIISIYIFFPKLELLVSLVGVICGVLPMAFIIVIVEIAKDFNFKFWYGLKLVVKFFLKEYILLIICLFISLSVIFAIGLNDTFYNFIIGIFCFSFFWISLFFFRIYDLISGHLFVLYAINIMKEVDIEDKSISFLPFNKKSKLQKCLILAYKKYVRDIKSLFSDKTISLMKFDSILKLSTLIGLINDNDKRSRKKILGILEKMQNTDERSHPIQFIRIMNEIDDFTKKYNIGNMFPGKREIVSRFGKYAILVIIVINIVISLVKYLELHLL